VLAGLACNNSASYRLVHLIHPIHPNPMHLVNWWSSSIHGEEVVKMDGWIGGIMNISQHLHSKIFRQQFYHLVGPKEPR